VVLKTVYFEPGIYKVKTQLDGQISLVFMEVDKIMSIHEIYRHVDEYCTIIDITRVNYASKYDISK